MKYILTKHTGNGFYTHDDRKNMSFFSFANGIAIVNGNYSEWIKRVGGKEISKNEARVKIKEYFETSRTNEIAQKRQEIIRLQNKTFNDENLTIH